MIKTYLVSGFSTGSVLEEHINGLDTVSDVNTSVNTAVTLVERVETWPHFAAENGHASSGVFEDAPDAAWDVVLGVVEEGGVVDALLPVVQLDLLLVLGEPEMAVV